LRCRAAQLEPPTAAPPRPCSPQVPAHVRNGPARARTRVASGETPASEQPDQGKVGEPRHGREHGHPFSPRGAAQTPPTSTAAQQLSAPRAPPPLARRGFHFRSLGAARLCTPSPGPCSAEKSSRSSHFEPPPPPAHPSSSPRACCRASRPSSRHSPLSKPPLVVDCRCVLVVETCRGCTPRRLARAHRKRTCGASPPFGHQRHAVAAHRHA
jgi:hypothetical protein